MTKATKTIRIIGKITGYHGIKGEIKVLPLVEESDFDQFKALEELFISKSEDSDLSETSLKISNIRFHKNQALMSFVGIPDRTAAEKYHGYLHAMWQEELAEGEFYIEDFKSATVYDSQDNEIGTVKNICTEGQTKFFIKLVDSFNKKNEIIVPNVDEYVLELNAKQSRLKLKLDSDFLDIFN